MSENTAAINCYSTELRRLSTNIRSKISSTFSTKVALVIAEANSNDKIITVTTVRNLVPGHLHLGLGFAAARQGISSILDS